MADGHKATNWPQRTWGSGKAAISGTGMALRWFKEGGAVQEWDEALTEWLWQRALELGADLFGVANVERYENAPRTVSPQGHMPDARSVVVVAIHHTDAAIEMGGRGGPHDMGPYGVQTWMNWRLDHIVFVLARELEERGFRALPMPVTNIWRFRPFGDVERPFVPDMSNIHAAAAAGLGDIGWSGLLLTPEFGPRQRLCVLLTNAPLKPTPLYSGPELCDRCGVCEQVCMTEALTREVEGIAEVRVEGKLWRYPLKNLWRCAWAEHFGLSLDLPKPERIDEQVILEQLARHGRRGGEMGSCLRFCLPPHMRHRDPGYTDTFRRRPDTAPAWRILDRPAGARARAIAWKFGCEEVAFVSAENCRRAGLDLARELPDAATLIVLRAPEAPGEERAAGQELLAFARHDIARELERLGYAAVALPRIDPGDAARVAGMDSSGAIGAIVASAPLAEGRWPAPERPWSEVGRLVMEAQGRRLSRAGAGAFAQRLFEALPGWVDLIGFASAAELDHLAGELKRIMDEQALSVDVVDAGGTHGPAKPEVRRREDAGLRGPSQLLPGAQSVIVLGCRLSPVALERAGLPEARAVGPYAAATYQARRELARAAHAIGCGLRAAGHQAVVVHDLLGTAGLQANPRGRQPDFRSSRFAAAAAGLGRLTLAGGVWTAQFGPGAVFCSIVTTAELRPTPPASFDAPCEGCDAPCLSACPTGAMDGPVEVTVRGRTERLARLDFLRCEWAKRWGLVGDEGPKFVGSLTDVPPPDGPITAEDIAAALAEMDPLQKHWLCVAEPCLLACFRRWAGLAGT